MIPVHCPHCGGRLDGEPEPKALGLSKRQRDCLTLIERLSANGVAPSLGELTAVMGYASRSATHRLLTCLRERGYVTWRPGSARSLTLLRPAAPAA